MKYSVAFFSLLALVAANPTHMLKRQDLEPITGAVDEQQRIDPSLSDNVNILVLFGDRSDLAGPFLGGESRIGRDAQGRPKNDKQCIDIAGDILPEIKRKANSVFVINPTTFRVKCTFYDEKNCRANKNGEKKIELGAVSQGIANFPDSLKNDAESYKCEYSR